MRKILPFFMIGLSVLPVAAEKLECNKVSQAIVEVGSVDVRPACELAEQRCRSLVSLVRRSSDDLLRTVLQPKLEAQVQYELEVCETAVREANPDYLIPRTLQDHR